jgi:protein TonB
MENKRKITLSIICFFYILIGISGSVFSQQSTHFEKKDSIEVLPQFPGGMDQFYRFIYKELKYPESCRFLDLQGVVELQFTIDNDGSVNNIKVIKQVYPDLDDEAVRVLAKSPKWIPGTHNGIPAKTVSRVSIRFELIKQEEIEPTN